VLLGRPFVYALAAADEFGIAHLLTNTPFHTMFAFRYV